MNVYKLTLSPLIALLVLLTSGCVKIWQDNLDIRTYMVEIERDQPARGAALADKLWIETVTVLPPFNVRNLILRESDVEFSTSYYTELLMSPSENFRNEFYVWLDDSEIFNEVSIAQRTGMSHRLVVNIIEFYGDKVNHAAVLRLKVTLFDEKAKGMNILLHEEYLHQVDMAAEVKGVHIDSLIRAYNEALTLILKECEQDIVDALK